MARLDNTTALITGSGRGIGRAIALRLAQEGANVVVNDLEATSDTAETLRLLEAAGARSHFIQADVGRVADATRLVEEAAAHVGRLDILVNNAGIEREAPFWETTEEDYDLLMGVNLKGAFFVTQAFVKQAMAAKQPGRVINISSTHETIPFPGHTTYCMSKGGMLMMTRNLASELGPHGITVNNVVPGAILTPMNAHLETEPDVMKHLLGNIPLRRLGQPEDVAAVVAFLASAEAAYVTGSSYTVDGGLTWHYEE